jgi:hypothetical protein
MAATSSPPDRERTLQRAGRRQGTRFMIAKNLIEDTLHRFDSFLSLRTPHVIEALGIVEESL